MASINAERATLIHNERTKLTATAINTTAVGLFAGGSALPIIALSYPLATAPSADLGAVVTVVGWSLSAMVLHGIARALLEELR